MPRNRIRLDLRAVLDLTELADEIVPFTLRAVTNLGVADHLAGGPSPLADLARRAGAHPRSLCRALRTLVRKGIFAEPEPGVFALNPPAELLRSGHPLSMNTAFRLIPSEVAAWTELTTGLRTGGIPFDLAHGTGYWDHLGANPDVAEWFHESQRASTRLETLAVARAVDWGRIGTVVDVGGGDGTFLAGLLSRNRALRGTVFDQAHAVAQAPKVLAGAGVTDRCEVLAGSFFDVPVPAGADCYLLKRVLYGWDDDRAETVLRAVRAAMRPDSTLLVLEPLAAPDDALALSLDLMMLALSSGRVRTEAELAAVLGRAELRITRIISTRMHPVVEAERC